MNGVMDRFKSKFVILGCMQQQGMDYGKTLAHVTKMATVRSWLVIAVQKWATLQMDVTKAILHGDLTEEVFILFSQGYK